MLDTGCRILNGCEPKNEQHNERTDESSSKSSGTSGGSGRYHPQHSIRRPGGGTCDPGNGGSGAEGNECGADAMAGTPSVWLSVTAFTNG
jgi:hypothetical protein